MTGSKIVRGIWIFNAVGFAVLILLIMGTLVSWQIAPFLRRDRDIGATNLVEPPPSTQPVAPIVEYALDNGTGLSGTNKIMFTLDRVTHGTKSLALKRGPRDADQRETVNILLVDMEDASGRWLFEGVNQVVDRVREIHGEDAATDETSDPPVLGLLVAIKTAKPGSEGGNDQGWQWTYLVDRLNGMAPQTVLQDIETVRRVTQSDPESLFFVYERDGRTIAARYSIETLEPVAEHELPRLATPATKDLTGVSP